MKARWLIPVGALWATVLVTAAAPQSGARRVPETQPAASTPPAAATPPVRTVPVQATRAAGTPSAPAAATAAATPDLKQFTDRYCVACHNTRAKTSATGSGVVFDGMDVTLLSANGEIWEKVVRKMRAGAMPPAGMPRADAATEERFITHIETVLDRDAAAHPNPGRPAPHRLNRAEYANAVRDLLALDVDPAALLPPDDSADGFDNNADVLGLSPALLDRYLAAAGKISALAVGSPAIGANSETYRVRGDASQGDHTEGLPLGTRGGLLATHTFPLDGEYLIKVKLLEGNLGSVRGIEFPHQLEIAVDGERKHLATVGGDQDYIDASLNATNVVNSIAARLQVRVKVKAGQRPVTAAFLARSAAQGGSRLQQFERTTLIATDHLGYPHVENMTISGPFNATAGGDTPSRRRLFSCKPATPAEEASCGRTIVSTLARRAYRRPVTAQDVEPLMTFFERGRRDGGFERGVEMALRAVLVSPKFIMRVEPTPAGAGQSPYRLNDIALASRLSFFLWSSIPDDELLDLAARGTLQRPAVLDAQFRRMLADPRADALVQNFAGQWLHMRNLRSAAPDKNEFPNFDDNLRQAFGRELELFVGSIIREDRSVLDLMTADHTFVNERLARHYGIPNVYGSQFRRITLTEEPRKGLLGKGGVLLVTSHADRTSPVVRGKWILENLIGTPPPPPPAEVPAFPDSGANAPTVRARMEQHRANPVCASCHKLMDPIGLALENFDAVGTWRERESGGPIDATGVLSDGQKVDGVVTLRQALLKRPEVLANTITEKLLTYALGRGLDHSDMPAVRAIVRASARDGYRVSTLIRETINSAPFRMRQPEPAAAGQAASATRPEGARP
jgi:mono/diheme cytochrome c family protein